MSLRRSARIASMPGAIYATIPSVKAQKEQEKKISTTSTATKASLAEELKKKHDEMKKEKIRQEGPLACRVTWYNEKHFDVSFNDSNGWAAKRYAHELVPGQFYDLVWVRIDRQDHSGYCSDVDEMTVNTSTVPLYFMKEQEETPLAEMLPLKCEWEHPTEYHYWCNAKERYMVLCVETVFIQEEDQSN